MIRTRFEAAFPMVPQGFRLYLASASPRRRELLRQIGVGFEPLLLRERAPRVPDVNEAALPGESPEHYVRRICSTKAGVAWTRIQERGLVRLPVLAADTTVCLDDVLLGKPTDRADAARMLRLLSGAAHRVLTAVAIQFGERMEMVVNDSMVRFCELSPKDIADYVDSGEPMDKAGAYGVQGRAAAFIPELRGSYSGVMGLPLYETAQLIERFARKNGA
jgi:septum formation protein